MNVDIWVLGATSIRIERTEVQVGGPRRRQLLGRLALGAPQTVTTERLIAALWPGGATERARATLHVHVSHLRQVLRLAGAPSLIVTEPDGYRLAVAADDIDVHRFTRLAEEGLRHVAAGRVARGRDLLADAVALWGEPFPELADEADIIVERHRLLGLAERAEDQYVEAELALGRAAHVIDEVSHRVAENPLREMAVEQLVRSLVALDRTDDAIQVVTTVARRTADEYGLEPSDDLGRRLDAIIAAGFSPAPHARHDMPHGVSLAALRPGRSVLLVADGAGDLTATIDRLTLVAQGELRRTVVIQPGPGDSAPLEAIDRAIGPLPEATASGGSRHDPYATPLAALSRHAGHGGLVVLVDVDRIDASVRAFAQRLLNDCDSLGLTIVGAASHEDVDLPFSTVVRVDDGTPREHAAARSVGVDGRLVPTLRVVALCEPEIPVPLLVRTVGEAAEILDHLAEARARQLVEDGSPGHLRLTEIGRESIAKSSALNDEAGCRGVHLALAEGVRHVDAISPMRRRAIEARHRLTALPEGDPAEAARATVLAADDALDVHLYAEALAQLEPAAGLVDELETTHPTDAAGLIERLARAHLRGARVAQGVDWARRLLAHARLHRSPTWLAEAVRLLGEQTAPQIVDDRLVALQREAIDATIDQPSDTTVQLLTDLAGALYFRDLDASKLHGERALDVARRVGTPASMARALTGKMQTLLGPDEVDQRLELAIEAQAAARRAELRHVQVHALTYEVYALFEQGRIDAVGPPLRYAIELADDVQFGRVEWWVRAWDALRLIAVGELDDAEALARDALERYSDPSRRDAFECYASQLMCLRLLTGDGGEIVPLAADLVDRAPGTIGYRGLLAFAASQAGDDRMANAQLDAAAGRIADLRPDAAVLTTCAMFAEAAWACERTDVAEELLPLIGPYVDSHAVLNIWGGGGFYWGPMSHAVGLVHRLTGHHERAANALWSAIQETSGCGTSPFAARSQRVLETIDGRPSDLRS